MQIREACFTFQTCSKLPEPGGRAVWHGGGLVDVKGRAMFAIGDRNRAVFTLNEAGEWSKVTDVMFRASLSVWKERLVAVGGSLLSISSKNVGLWDGEKWTPMTDMLIGCRGSCVVNDGVDGLVVMGGVGDGRRSMDVVQWFDGETQTWFFGPSLPQRCYDMSAVVYDGEVFVLGGDEMGHSVWSSSISELVSKALCIFAAHCLFVQMSICINFKACLW